MTNITETEALNKVAAYCSAAEHCRAEISEKLQRWGLPYDAIDRILKRLVYDKYRVAKWGKVKIAQALQLKKVPYNTCRQFLNEIDEEEYLSILDRLLTAKRKSIHAENEYELNGKLKRFALSRGFEMKDIRHCIQLSDENDDFE